MLATDLKSLAETIADLNYSGKVIKLVQELATAKSSNQVLDLLFEVAGVMEADCAAFVTYIRGDWSHENFRFVLACDPRWCFEYQKTAAYSLDPWIMYASTNTEPICASQITGLTRAQREVHELAIRYGMNSTCVIPAPSSGALTRVGMLAIGSRQAGYFEGPGLREFSVLGRSLAMELQGWCIRRLRQELIEERGLTSEDLQLLAFERAGQGTKQIATDLGISVTAVDSRWKRLNQKLSTANRKASASMAAAYGVI